MISEQRDPAFWERIANDPSVAPHLVLGAYRQDMTTIVRSPRVVPLATELGGFVFIALDPLCGLYEAHRMFLPQGRGRHALGAALEAVQVMFGRGAACLTARESAGAPWSRPPLSFGWRPAAPLDNKHRLWLLPKVAWEASPARQRALRGRPDLRHR